MSIFYMLLVVFLPIISGIELVGAQLITNLPGAVINFTEVVVNSSKELNNASAQLDDKILRALKEIFDPNNIAVSPPSDDLVEKCCGNYGCFAVLPLSEFPLCQRLLPLCQDVLNVRFYLWTRENPEVKDIIDPENPTTLTTSHFRKVDCVFIFIHGWLLSGDMFFIRDMKDAILRKRDCMFISVEWMIGARMEYSLAVANTQMVSAVTASMIEQIMETYNIDAEILHIVGFSLGAHIAGGVGKRIKGIRRITGLDPARASFEDCNSTLRLSRTDALYVDVMHTNLLVFGIKTPSGHVDIFVNGGYSQPACFGIAVCNHLLSIFYFIDTIEAECPYLAYQCDDQDNFMRGLCSTGCGDENELCVPLGYNADEWQDNARESPTLFFMSIGANKNYCVYHYYVEINCTDEQVRLWRYGRNKDKLFINLVGSNNETGMQQANINSIRYTTLPYITTLITSETQIGQILSVILKWVPSEEVPPSTDCQNGNITEPTATCCIENFDSVRGRCLMCPYIITSIYATNLETGNSARFAGRNEALPANQESSFDSQ